MGETISRIHLTCHLTLIVEALQIEAVSTAVVVVSTVLRVRRLFQTARCSPLVKGKRTEPPVEAYVNMETWKNNRHISASL